MLNREFTSGPMMSRHDSPPKYQLLMNREPFHLPAPKEREGTATQKLQLPPCNFINILKNKLLFWKGNIYGM